MSRNPTDDSALPQSVHKMMYLPMFKFFQREFQECAELIYIDLYSLQEVRSFV